MLKINKFYNNKKKHLKQSKVTMDKIKVKFDPSRNMISVWNNGKDIPVE